MRRPLLTLLSLLAALAVPAVASAAQELPTSAPLDGGGLSPHAALRKADAIVQGGASSRGRELTPLLKEVAAAQPSLSAADRRRADRLLARPVPGQANSNESAYTVPEHSPPLCSEHFCIHWVDSTDDAPPLADGNGNGIPDYVEMMDGIFEHVYQVENVQMGWRPPKSDGSKGCPNPPTADCLDKTDVYLKNVGDQSIYGYSAPDPAQRTFSQTAYLVMDNDYAEPVFRQRYPDGPMRPAEVTAAHEYNHVLQFGYDVLQDTWMFESTATWMEDKVYTDINDYLQYLTPWAQLSQVPLTRFDSSNPNDQLNVKVYGDMVWNRWLDARYGQDIVRSAWEHSLTSTPKSFAPGSYDQALNAHGSSFFNAFTSFAADTAEWRAANTRFPEGSTFPDMGRVQLPSLRANHGGVRGALNHTGYGLADVAPSSAPRIKLVFDSARHARLAIALVGLAGDQTSGSSTVKLKRLPHGGSGTVTLSDPGHYTRITAALINGDAGTTGRFSNSAQDWIWTGDNVKFTAHVSTDFTRPRITHRSPVPGKRGVSRRAPVKIRFSEPLTGLSKSTVKLVGPGGHRVSARLSIASNGRSVLVRPSHGLRAHTRYTLHLGSGIDDRGGNRLPSASRSWSFTTAP